MFQVTGHRDKVSQQIQTKLGDYHLAQTFIDDPSKSIGICAEPPSPAPCKYCHNFSLLYELCAYLKKSEPQLVDIPKQYYLHFSLHTADCSKDKAEAAKLFCSCYSGFMKRKGF